MLRPYTKNPITISEQVKLLQKRGLIVKDTEQAEKFLKQVNYYRFSGYCLIYESKRHHFKPSVTFEHIVRVYKYDQELRDHVLKTLAPIENYFRAHIAYYLSGASNNPFVHYKNDYFRTYSAHKFSFNHRKWIENLSKEVKRSKEIFIKHYKNTYTCFPEIPIWVATEIMSLGSLSQLYKGLRNRHQALISKNFSINRGVLLSWLHSITYLRNMCAHHSRILGRELAIKPRLPEKEPLWTSLDCRYLYAMLVIIEYLYRQADIYLEPVKATLSCLMRILDDESEFMRTSGVKKSWNGELFWG